MCSPLIAILFWILVIVLIIMLIVSCFNYNSRVNYGLGVIFWILLFAIIIALIFDENVCGRCRKSPCSCCKICFNSPCSCISGNNSSWKNARVDYNATATQVANIQLESHAVDKDQRQVLNLTINGTECVNDNKFSCDITGFNEVANIALPKSCDVLEGTNINDPIALYSFTTPHGTVFTLNYVIPHGTSYITAVPVDNIVVTGQIALYAQNNMTFDNLNVVRYPKKEVCDN